MTVSILQDLKTILYLESDLSYDAKRRFCNLMSETDTSKIDDSQVYDFYLRIPFIPESASQVSSDILQLNTPCLNKRVQVIFG